MAKDLLSFPDILSNMGGIEMLADTIRKTSGQSADQDKNTFKAIVLRGTDGTQTNNAALGGALGSNDLTKSNRNRAGITRTYFVKILEDSPHAYLPDPCIQGSTQITETNNNHLIQGMYTYAIDQSGQPLNENDIILLRLEKRDFGYDTDIGYIVGVVGQKEAAKLKAEEEIGCASPSSAFNNKNLSVFDNQGQTSNNKPAILGGVPSTVSDINTAYPEIAAVPGWAEKIVEVAGRLGIPDPGWLANVMWFESRLDPAATNASYGCTGLIQFCPNSGAKKVGKTTDELRAMGAIEQMDYVEKYLRSYRGRMNTSADLYMAIFFPVAVGMGPSYDIYNWYFVNKGPKTAEGYLKANNGIRTSGDYQSFADRRARLPTALGQEVV